MKFLERHPLPWIAEEHTFCDAYFVRDANKSTVVIVSAMDETGETKVDEVSGEQMRITIKRPKPGAYQLAKTIAALPRLMAAVTDAHGYFDQRADIIDNDGGPQVPNEAMTLAATLEKLIEELA